MHWLWSLTVVSLHFRPMESEKDAARDNKLSSRAVVNFVSAAQANRHIAGLPVAARLVREIAEAGFTELWLVLPSGQDLDRTTREEVERLRGGLTIRSSNVPPTGAAVILASTELVPAAMLRDPPARIEDSIIRLDRHDASARILKQTGKASDGLVSRWLNRPMSRRISAVLLRFPMIRPVHVTWFNALLALVMFAVVVFGGSTGLVIGALLFQACSMLDGVDGEMARATFRSSDFGASLDSAVDMATNLLFFIGALINLWIGGSRGPVLFGVWGVVLIAIGSVIVARRGRGPSLSFDHVKRSYRTRFTGPVGSKLVRAGTFVTSRDFFCLLGVVVVLGGVPEAIPYIIGILATGWMPFVLDLPARVAGWFSVKGGAR